MARTAAHSRVPHQWTKNEGAKLTPIAFKLYFVLLSFAHHSTRECTIRQQKLVDMTMVSRTKLHGFLTELANAGLVTYAPEERTRKEGKIITYIVHDPMQIHLLNVSP